MVIRNKCLHMCVSWCNQWSMLISYAASCVNGYTHYSPNRTRCMFVYMHTIQNLSHRKNKWRHNNYIEPTICLHQHTTANCPCMICCAWVLPPFQWTYCSVHAHTHTYVHVCIYVLKYSHTDLSVDLLLPLPSTVHNSILLPFGLLSDII